MGKNSDFARKMIQWYTINKRELPWRQTSDPYYIWLSEIILQQTRIEQGLSYYLRFTERYPDVFKFANAPEDDILKLWQGLGYYSRARNMHTAAKRICKEFSGNFPKSYKELLSLKGVGEYTAAAIASIAFNLPHAVVDGNVYRVLSRIFGIYDPINTSLGKKTFQELATTLLDERQAGNYNQAIMEFGALHCKPQNPKCEECPFIETCHAYNNKSIKNLPVKKGKTKVVDRYFNYIIIKYDDFTFLNKRSEDGIWKNLFEFPLIETDEQVDLDILIPDLEKLLGNNSVLIEHISNWNKHILSHQRIHYRFLTLRINEEKKFTVDLIKVNKKDIFKFAVPKLIERELNNNNWFLSIHL
ncbi:A/G-specific adenine glycosylase [Sunxiuqinia sp. A32]|uniref:A/G-specific adenine glycosylase n=1 Tax=Sunxiuqinia sp. A32 TaxID=3461496 RepID=UPI004045FBB3